MRDYYSMGAFFNSIDEWGLLHGTGSIQPNPTLFLTSPEQDKAIAGQSAAIAAAEAELAARCGSVRPNFQAWLATPTAEMTDLSGSYDLDAREKNELRECRRSQTSGEIQ